IAAVTLVGTGSTGNAAAAPATASYVPVTPFRLADTRNSACGCVRIDAATISVQVAGRGGVTEGATAVAVTVTSPVSAAVGYVTVYPGGTTRPLASALNTRPDRPVANSAIIQLGAAGTIELYENVPGDLIVDLTGAFVPSASARGGRF